jgi:ribosome-binding factor A
MSNIRDIKHAQKESLFYRALSEIYLNLTMEEPQLAGIFINNIVLSKDKGTCTILFFCVDQERFEEAFHTLILYKPSMRKSLGIKIRSRYTPQIRFAFDKKCERQQNLEAALHEVSKELNPVVPYSKDDDTTDDDDTATDS